MKTINAAVVAINILEPFLSFSMIENYRDQRQNSVFQDTAIHFFAKTDII